MDLFKCMVLPSGFIAAFFVVGFIFLGTKKLRKTGGLFVLIGAVIYVALITGTLSNSFLEYFESKYHTNEESILDVNSKFIVVMAGYGINNKKIPTISRISASSLYRVIEALHLWRLNRGRKIVISGYKNVPLLMRDVLMELGVPANNIIIDNDSHNTYFSAINVINLVEEEKFFLITSAGHMPRTMAIFRKLNRLPVPVLTDYFIYHGNSLESALPKAQHLMAAELAVHETFAMLWYRLQGRI